MTPVAPATSNAGPDNVRPLTADEVCTYNEHGLVMIPGLFTPEEVKPLEEALAHDPTMGNSRIEVLDPEDKSWKVSTWYLASTAAPTRARSPARSQLIATTKKTVVCKRSRVHTVWVGLTMSRSQTPSEPTQSAWSTRSSPRGARDENS